MTIGIIGIIGACNLALIAGGVSVAASKSASGSVKACVSKKHVLSIESHGKCAKKTTVITLGQRGRTGDRGPAGRMGVSGLSHAYANKTGSSTGEIDLPAGSYAFTWSTTTTTNFQASSKTSTFLLKQSCDLITGTTINASTKLISGEVATAPALYVSTETADPTRSNYVSYPSMSGEGQYTLTAPSAVSVYCSPTNIYGASYYSTPAPDDTVVATVEAVAVNNLS